jgi:hypothetical protein
LSPEEHLRVIDGKFGFVKPPPRDICIRIGAVDVLKEREEDPMVRREIRVKRDIEQADVLGAR